jgi:WD40 repeat protein
VFAGNRLCAGLEDGRVQVWDISRNQQIQGLSIGRSVLSLAYYPQIGLAIGLDAGGVVLWNMRGRTSIEETDSGVTSVAYSPTAKLVAGLQNGFFQILNSGSRFRAGDSVLSVDFGPQETITTGLFDGNIRSWRLQGERLYEYRIGIPVRSLAYSPNKEVLVAGTITTLTIITVPTRERLNIDVPSGVTSIAFISNNQFVIGLLGGSIRVYTITGELIQEIEIGEMVWSVAYTFDGNLAVGLENSGVRLYTQIERGTRN